MVLDERLYLDKHPMPGKWMPNGCMATSGSLLRWEQGIFDAAPLEELDSAAASSTPGALLSLPYFLGEKTPLNDPNLRGVIIGLHLGTTRGDIHRSFLEAIAYGFRSHFDVFAENGLNLTVARVTNGGSKSRLWREILADVLNRELISIIDHPGASYGAAVIAGVGAGRIDEWSYVAGSLEAGEILSPNPANVSLYDERYDEYLQLNDATAAFSHRLARSSS
jgi:xylulokinase